jgi:hypothetical protein
MCIRLPSGLSTVSSHRNSIYLLVADAICQRLDHGDQILLNKLEQIIQRLDKHAVPCQVHSRNCSPPIIQTPETHLTYLAVPFPHRPLTSDTFQNIDSRYEGEEMKIPGVRFSADTILAWPIFKQQYPSDYLIQSLFEDELDSRGNKTDATRRHFPRPFEDIQLPADFSVQGRIKQYTDVFLAIVLPKNPILPEGTLRRYAKEVERDGIEKDEKSCLVVSEVCGSNYLLPIDTAKRRRIDEALFSQSSNRPEASSLCNRFIGKAILGLCCECTFSTLWGLYLAARLSQRPSDSGSLLQSCPRKNRSLWKHNWCCSMSLFIGRVYVISIETSRSLAMPCSSLGFTQRYLERPIPGT